MASENRIKSVAIIGAGASGTVDALINHHIAKSPITGAITAAAFAAENFFERIQVFDRRESAGGTWIYDASPPAKLPLQPGKLPPDVDPPLRIPDSFPQITSPNNQERYTATPVYASLTTNVPSIAMSFSDLPFAYGPFVPHHISKQYIESYFSHHKIDSLLKLSTTVEDLSVVREQDTKSEKWNLTLRKHDPVRRVDVWWQEQFDAVIIANGHYSVPFIPEVKGLTKYMEKFPGRIVHSKTYRTPLLYQGKKVLIIGNSASGHDLTAELISTASLPVIQSRRSPSRWDGDEPPAGIAWKPIITEYLPSGRIIFEDGTHLDDIDTVIYATGYKPSYPFWNSKKNGRPLWDYEGNKLIKTYLHTFFHDFSTLAIVGIPRVLTFRSFEYQAIALARVYSGRQSIGLPPLKEQEKWESKRAEQRKKEGKKFHDIEWDTGETIEWLGELYHIAGLGLLTGEGRVPPVLGPNLRWALKHIRKYPEPGENELDSKDLEGLLGRNGEDKWVVVKRRPVKDSLAFI